MNMAMIGFHMGVAVCFGLLFGASNLWADEPDWTVWQSSGESSPILACLEVSRRARDFCEDSGEGFTEDRDWGCPRHCERNGAEYMCEARFFCDASKPPSKSDRALSATGFARLPTELNPCKAAKRDGYRQMREECESLDGVLEDLNAESCTCKPLTFRPSGEPAAECEIPVTALCNRTD